MDNNNIIPFLDSKENVSLIFNEVSKRSVHSVCIEGRYFSVASSGNNAVHMQHIQTKISKLSSEPNLKTAEFFCNALGCNESDLSYKNLEAINTLKASILSNPDQKKEYAELVNKIDLASQNTTHTKLLATLEQKEKILEKLSTKSNDLINNAYYHRHTFIDSIQSLAALLKLSQVEAQYKKHRIELLEIKLKLYQLLPANTEKEKQQAANNLSSMLCDAIVTEHIAYAHHLIKANVELELYHLFGAILANSSQMIDLLVKEGLDPNSKTNSGDSLLWMACLRGQNAANAIEALVENGANLTALNSDGESPIHQAICSDLESKKVIALLEKVQKPNFQDGTGCSLLHEAITRIGLERDDAPFNYLLDVQKATPNVKDTNGATLIHHAIERLGEKSLPIIEKLIEKGALVTALDNQGRTPLHLAAKMSNRITLDGKKDNGAIVRTLIKSGAAVNAMDLKGRTALHEAVEGGTDLTNLKSVEELIKGGIDLNIQDQEGNTALHLAAAGQHVELVELLLKHGAERHLRNNTGRLPGAAGLFHSEIRRQKILDLLAKI